MKRQEVVYDGVPVGIVVPQDGVLRFVAVKFHVIDLDKKLFQSLGDLNRAIKAHLEMPVAA
jgi:hypothetical protein